MAKALSYDVKTKQTTEYEVEFTEHVKTEEEFEQEYRQKVRELIGQRYDISQEIGLNADNQLAIMASEEPSQKWIDYRAYVNECKDTAYLSVYGHER
jgi:uncharacterized short protein YbdD (DUF466 family)